MANKKKNSLETFGGDSIDLKKFNLKSEKEQYAIIEAKLKEIYKDDLEVTRKHVMKVIGLTCSTKDDYIYLPHNLKLSKEKLSLNFSYQKRVIGFGWILFSIWLLLFALIGATYSGIRFVNMRELNKDIDGDGVADINIDINNDGKSDINVDTNKDNKPNLNVDYKGNRRAVFNIDSDDDGKPDYNLVSDASTPEKLKECTINCDINGDGWPDLNLDLDGDGKPDIDVDTDNDGVADLNIDVNGDGVSDIMCDEDGDNKCDYNCLTPPYNGLGTGTSSTTGNPNDNTGTAMLILRFIDGETVNVDNLVPDDQPLMPGEKIVTPYKTFTIENLSDYSMEYSLKWKVVENTFITNNLQYKVTGTNGGVSLGYRVAPKGDAYIAQRIKIPARSTQKYTIDFTLMGTNKPQNEDQGKMFKGKVEIET